MIATQNFSILYDEKTPIHSAKLDNNQTQHGWHRLYMLVAKLFRPFIATTATEYNRVISEYPH